MQTDTAPRSTPTALFADLYEFTMMQAYQTEGLTGPATFSLFARRLSASRSYLMACGLETVLQTVEALRFAGEDIAYLSSLRLFSDQFLLSLSDFRFEGDIDAVPEGTAVFANEPLLEVTAPLPQAQLIETLAMNQIHLQTVLATKAARVVTAAAGRPVIDFGARRIHGIDAADKGARAFHVGGVAATSNTEAGIRYGIPVTGTMAHSYVQAHETEAAAFEAFARLFPGSTMLVDTYDTMRAVGTLIGLVKRRNDPLRISAVRLDSGDLLTLSCQVRSMLDEAGLPAIRIVASGGLDEYEIDRLVQSGAPIDSFGIGTSMGVSEDAPSLDIAYKLTEYDGKGRTKLSAGKSILPGRKQIFRRFEDGCPTGDTIGLARETLPGVGLIQPVMRKGKRLYPAGSSLTAARLRASETLASLPRHLKSLLAAEPYPVAISRELSALHDEACRRAVAMSSLESGN